MTPSLSAPSTSLPHTPLRLRAGQWANTFPWSLLQQQPLFSPAPVCPPPSTAPQAAQNRLEPATSDEPSFDVAMPTYCQPASADHWALGEGMGANSTPASTASAASDTCASSPSSVDSSAALSTAASSPACAASAAVSDPVSAVGQTLPYISTLDQSGSTNGSASGGGGDGGGWRLRTLVTGWRVPKAARPH